MHRSGTSALTGMLQQLGIDLGSETMSAQEDNIKGFFENKKMLDLNIKILHENFSSYQDTEYSLNIAKEKQKSYALEAQNIIEKEFVKSDLFALKDPRTCMTFPIWEEALQALNIKIRIILPYRNPFEIAASLKKRNGFSLEKSLVLWAKYFFHAELYSRNYPRYFIDFSSLVNNTNEVLHNLESFLNIQEDDIGKRIEGFIEKDLKHHNLPYSIQDEKIPHFLFSILQMMETETLNETEYETYDSLRAEFLAYRNMFHQTDVVMQLSPIKSININAAKMKKNNIQFQKEITYKSQQISDLNVENHSLRKEIASLHDKLSRKDIIVDKLSTQKALQEQDNAKKTHAIEKLHQLLDETFEKITQLEENCTELHHNLDIHKKQNETLKKSLTEQQNIQDMLAQTNNTLKSDLDIKGKELKELYADKAKLEQRYTNKLHEVETISSQLDEILEDLISIKTSKSWIHTKPIRTLHKIFKGSK